MESRASGGPWPKFRSMTMGECGFVQCIWKPMSGFMRNAIKIYWCITEAHVAEKMRVIRRPTPLKGKATLETAQAWFKELVKYESVLREWDAVLEEKESALDAWESQVVQNNSEDEHGTEFKIPWLSSSYNGCHWNFPPLRPAHSEKDRKEIDDLEKLYKLPDRRRAKKK
jgi:hypothetical protein